MPPKRMEPLKRSAFRLVLSSGAVDGLLLMPHPRRWQRMRAIALLLLYASCEFCWGTPGTN